MNAGPTSHEPPRVDLTAKVAFLLRGAFPSPPRTVETHMSWVFLTDGFAYKLKKPVRHRFLDYRTIEARRTDCEAEVALNAPLAPGVYLGTAALTQGPEGRLAIDGGGEIVDWLVVMRRLPNEWMLPDRIATGTVEPGDLDDLVDHLVAFYRGTEPSPLTPAAFRRRLLDTLDVDFDELLRPNHLLDRSPVRELRGLLGTAVNTWPELDERAGKVVDGHGDLRPEHVLLDSGPLVIDRITFDPELRHVDPLHDLALLSIECELLGRSDLGRTIIDGFRERAADPAGPSTVELYCSLRAVTRARLSVAHLSDGDRDEAAWLARTDAYLVVARRHADRAFRLHDHPGISSPGATTH